MVHSVLYRIHDLCAENLDTLSYDRPDEFEIDPEVLVDNIVPERDDLSPRNLGVRLANFGRNRATGFASSVYRRSISRVSTEHQPPMNADQRGLTAQKPLLCPRRGRVRRFQECGHRPPTT